MTAMILAGFVVLSVSAILFRALAMKPPAPPAAGAALPDPVDADGAASKLSALIQKPTVSSREPDG